MKRYDSFTQNLFRQLAKGNQVLYRDFLLTVKEDKLVVRAASEGKQIEFHYRLRKGDDFGFSKEQLKDIFANREKPIYTVTIKSTRG